MYLSILRSLVRKDWRNSGRMKNRIMVGLAVFALLCASIFVVKIYSDTDDNTVDKQDTAATKTVDKSDKKITKNKKKEIIEDKYFYKNLRNEFEMVLGEKVKYNSINTGQKNEVYFETEDKKLYKVVHDNEKISHYEEIQNDYEDQ